MKKIFLLIMMLAFLVACGGSEEPADVATDTPTEAATEVVDAATAVVDEATDMPSEEATTEVADTDDTVVVATDGLDISYFYENALEAANLVDCTLSDGTATSCYEITIAGYPANHDVGPFCPPTIESTADEGGLWLDGTNVYDIDGAFIVSLPEIYNDDNWQMYDEDGNVNITDTAEEFDLAARPDVDPSLQNHCVEGRIEWLENGEPVPTTVTIPATPVLADSASAGGNWGITLNGVIIAAQAPVDAILSAYTIAAFDDCGGHINPVDGYHLHGARGCSEVGEAPEGETPIFAYAMDGFPVHSPLAADVEAVTDLDECNGHTTEEFGYHYHANPAEENGVLTCFMGVTVGGGQDGPGGGGGDRPEGGPPDGDAGGPGAQGGQPGDAPDFAAAAAILGVTEQELQDALGGPPPDFAAAAEALGVSEEALQAAIAGEGAPLADETVDAPSGEVQMVDDGIANVGEGRTFTLPGDNIFPEGVSYDPATGKFYVGATSDGTLYVGDVNGSAEMTVFSEAGADGRTTAVGTKVDADGNLWVAGGGTGQMFVYDTTDSSLIASYTTPATDATFINDMTVTESGVYFTDSFRPILWRVTDLESGEAEVWLDFTGSVLNYVDGFNLNGIVATEDGSALIVVHSGEGELYRIDVATQEVVRIDTGDIPLTAGDGLALVGNTIYVTRNSFGEIVELALSDDLSVGTGGDVITSDLFGYPTTIAYTGNTFLVANSQFNNRGGTPNLPFTVAQIPLPQGEY